MFLRPIRFLIITLILSGIQIPLLTGARPLFVLYDMGDTNGLKPVIDAFEKTSHPYALITLGKASDIFATDAHKLLAFPTKWERKARLSTDDFTRLLQAPLPTSVVTGMASHAQAQIANFYARRNIPVYAFYDNFDDITNVPSFHPFMDEIMPSGVMYLVPSQPAADSFAAHPKTQADDIYIVGNPDLESWDQVFAETDPATLFHALHLSPEKPIILYAGGYGPEYEAYFPVFLKAMAKNPQYQILVTYHPKTDGDFEKKSLESLGSPSHIQIVPKDLPGINTTSLAKIASLFACYKSTAGIKALSKGVPVLFVAEQSYDNPAISQGLASLVSFEEDVKEATESLLHNPTTPSLAPIGVPTDATQNIYDIIKAY